MSATRITALALAALLASGTLFPSSANAVEIRGKVIHPTRPGGAADIEVRLLGLTEDEEPIRADTRTDGDGNYRFEDLPAPATYLIAASYDGISFPGGTLSFPEADSPPKPPLTFHIYDRTADPSSLTAPSLRWIVEREADSYRVAQSIAVHNSRSGVVVVDEAAAPLLRMPLAPAHGEVRTAFGRLPEGVTIRDGIAELRGPFLPGEREIRLSYDLPADGDLQTVIGALQPTATNGGGAWELGAPRIERLELYLKDFGIAVDGGDLYPARPVRDGDVTYLSFLGFELEPGTRYPIRITPLPPSSGPPTWASILLISLLAGGSLYLVGRPVAAGSAERVEVSEVADVEKRALRDALADLDFDFETGKLSVQDRDRLRGELKREAVRSLARRRRAVTTESSAVQAILCKCGHRPRPGDRFCAACGKSL